MFEEPNVNGRVLAIVGGPQAWQVIAACADIYFFDGTQLTVHRVAVEQATHTWLRATAVAGQWLIFDLRHVCPDTAADMQAAHWLDQHGCFYYGLRTRWSGANALLRAVRSAQLNAVSPELELAA